MIFNERTDEIWADTDYEGYQVSNLGRVRSRRTRDGLVDEWHVLKLTESAHGYLQVHIRLVDTDFTIRVHQLVAKAFVPNPNDYKCINHKNEIRYDNRADNLEWCTAAYNNSYGKRSDKMGESCSRPVIAIFPDGSRQWFRSSMDASRKLNCQQANIFKCATGQRKYHKGYQFEYADDI